MIMLLQQYQTFNPWRTPWLLNSFSSESKSIWQPKWLVSEAAMNECWCNNLQSIFSTLNINHPTTPHSPLLHPTFNSNQLVLWPPFPFYTGYWKRQPKYQLIRVKSNKFRMQQGWMWGSWMVNVEKNWLQVVASTFILCCFRYQLFQLPVTFVFRGTSIL